MKSEREIDASPARGEALLRRLRLRHLHLLAILGSGITLRAAALQLHVTEPAASKMIREIEAACGTTLFERSPRGIRANPAAAALIARARGIVSEVAAAGVEQSAIARGAAVRLRIGAPPFIAAGPVARAVAELKREMPAVLVVLLEGGAPSVLDALAERRVDCAVCGVDPGFAHAGALKELRIERLYPDRLCVIAAHDHPLSSRRRLAWRDLASARWVLPGNHSPVRRALVDTYLSLGLHPPQPQIEAGPANVVAGFVRADPNLVGLVRVDGARAELRRGGMQLLDVRPAVALAPISVLYREQASVAGEALARLVTKLQAAAAAAPRVMRARHDQRWRTRGVS
ncbi:MAG: LysR family transcriptional regulator [Burkholderiales bacterium]|nr:LysR family transcriptional regulator [Burkholderiales bacterium]